METAKTKAIKFSVIVGIILIFFIVVVPLVAGLMFVPKIRAVLDSNVIGQIAEKIAEKSATGTASSHSYVESQSGGLSRPD